MKKTGLGLLISLFSLCFSMVTPAFPTLITSPSNADLYGVSPINSDYQSAGQSTSSAIGNLGFPVTTNDFRIDLRYFARSDSSGQSSHNATCEVNVFPTLDVSFLKGDIVCAYMIEASDNFNWIFTVWTLHACDFVAPAFQKPC